MIRTFRSSLVLFLLIVISACTVGPRYKRPTVDLPVTYRGAEANSPSNDPQSFGDQKWADVFEDEQLRRLIATALQQNYDVRRAGERILAAQARLGITRADQYPAISGTAAAVNERTPKGKVLPPLETSATSVGVGFSWELDFWGRYRRATEAARANLAATEWGRREILTELVSDLAASYFRLRALDLQLEISRQTLAARKDSLRLTTLLEQGGATSLLDVRQAEQLVYTAGSQVPALEQQIEQQENSISILMGAFPGTVQRGKGLREQARPPAVPIGLTSSLLERRPDIRQAEEQLIAANAEIGVARSLYFPQIALTANAGYQSTALSNLFTGPGGLWTFGSTAAQPIFTGGRLRSNVRLTEAQEREAVLFYQETVQNAFRDVSDALIAYRKTQDFREQQQLLVDAAADASRLSQHRYSGGAASYLEVLTNDTNHFTAELNLVQAQLNELLALVQLYRALGGGWQ